MLQQTQVQTVIPYYERFLDWFLPLGIWLKLQKEKTPQGLGRIGLLFTCPKHAKAAQQIMDDFDGQFPDTYENIAKLKGIGPILLVLFLASLLDSQSPLLMVMLCGLWPVSLRLTTISETPKS